MPGGAWKETRPGRYERPQSCLERICLVSRNVEKAPDRDCWAKTAVTKLEFHPNLGDPIVALKNAWKQVRYNYPEVAAFPYDGIYMYRIGNPDQVSLWVSATFVVEPEMSVDQLFGHLPRNEQMMCYYLPKTSEVLIRSPHYRLDARGALFILNYLIEALANPDPVLIFGGCANNLSPSVDEALEIPMTPAEYTPQIEKMALKRLAALQPSKPLLELQPATTTKPPRATKRRVLKLSNQETHALLESCDANQLNLTATLHAALVAAVAATAKPTTPSSYMASFHCDLRALIPESSHTKHAPTACTSTLTTDVEVSPTTDLRAYYAQLAPVHAAGYTPYLASTGCYHEKLAAAQFPGGRTSGDADGAAQPRFGPLGVIERQLTQEVARAVKVVDFWLGAETLTKRMMVHSWVHQGRIVFSCCYNESFWEDGFVEGFLERIKERLLEEVVIVGLMEKAAIR